MEQFLSVIYTFLATYGLRIVAALVIFIVGRWVAKLASRLVKKAMLKAKIDETLAGFTQNLCYIAMLAFVIIAALEKLGVRMTSFVVIVGAAGLAVTLLQTWHRPESLRTCDRHIRYRLSGDASIRP